eukprot:jgi/Tetstr1/456138/TSEL_042907.t1
MGSVVLNVRDGFLTASGAFDLKDDLKASGRKRRAESRPEGGREHLQPRRLSYSKPVELRIAEEAGFHYFAAANAFPIKDALREMGGWYWHTADKTWRKRLEDWVGSYVLEEVQTVRELCDAHGLQLLDNTRPAAPVAPHRVVEDAEWMAIVQQDLGPDELMKIVAAAGAGKSTVLQEYIRRRPSLRSLYLCYNKDQADEKAKLFRDAGLANVAVMTFHSLAFKATFHIHRHMVGNFVDIGVEMVGRDYKLKADVKETLKNFMASKDGAIGAAHLPSNPRNRKRCLEVSIRVWQAMMDPEDERVKITHDGYLKVFQLRPDLQPDSFREYDLLMLDEAHDNTDCQLQVFQCQRTPKILVYDPHQAIYQFRGANGARSLDQIAATHTKRLSTSFRYGQLVASFASSIVRFFKLVEFPVRSLPSKLTDIIITSALPGGDVYSYVVGQQRKPLLVLARQNNTLFTEVAKALRCPLVRSIAFIGGVDAGCGGTRDIMDLYRLWAGRPRDEIESPLIAKWGRNTSARPYGGFVAFKAAMEETREPAWGVKCGLVEAHGHAVPGIIEQMRAKSVSEVCRADVVFSTTHKAKGASWGHVYMSGDYISSGLAVSEVPGAAQMLRRHNGGADLPHLAEEEVNLAYIAATRAVAALYINPRSWGWLRHAAAQGGVAPTVAPVQEDEDGDEGGAGDGDDGDGVGDVGDGDGDDDGYGEVEDDGYPF